MRPRLTRCPATAPPRTIQPPPPKPCAGARIRPFPRGDRRASGLFVRASSSSLGELDLTARLLEQDVCSRVPAACDPPQTSYGPRSNPDARSLRPGEFPPGPRLHRRRATPGACLRPPASARRGPAGSAPPASGRHARAGSDPPPVAGGRTVTLRRFLRRGRLLLRRTRRFRGRPLLRCSCTIRRRSHHPRRSRLICVPPSRQNWHG